MTNKFPEKNILSTIQPKTTEIPMEWNNRTEQSYIDNGFADLLANKVTTFLTLLKKVF